MLAGIVVAVSPTVALAQQRDVPQLAVGRLTGDARPTIDGIVDEGIWSTSVPHSTFTQQEPNEGQPATERTDVWFLLDSTNLYIAVVCHDSQPDRLVVTQSRRDANLTNTDSIQILLDTFNDGQNAFVFGTNPFGIEYDGQVMGEGQIGGRGGGGGGSQRGQLRGFNTNWDADFTVRAQPTARGWEAEFEIPLKTLRYAPGEDRVWGSTSCGLSGGRMSRSSWRRCPAATRSIASRSPAS